MKKRIVLAVLTVFVLGGCNSKTPSAAESEELKTLADKYDTLSQAYQEQGKRIATLEAETKRLNQRLLADDARIATLIDINTTHMEKTRTYIDKLLEAHVKYVEDSGKRATQLREDLDTLDNRCEYTFEYLTEVTRINTEKIDGVWTLVRGRNR